MGDRPDARADAPPLGRDAWHALHAEEALTAFASHPARGLTAEVAARRLARYGPNTLRGPMPRSLVLVFARQFKSPLISPLIGAAALALGLGHPRDAAVIGAVPVLNAAIGALHDLVTGGMPTMTLVMETPEGEELAERLVPREEAARTRVMRGRLAVPVPAMAATTLGWFTWRRGAGVPFARAQTETFTLLAACQWFNALNRASGAGVGAAPAPPAHPVARRRARRGAPAPVSGGVSAPAGGAVRHGAGGRGGAAHDRRGGASLMLWVEELRKWAARRRHGKTEGARPQAG